MIFLFPKQRRLIFKPTHTHHHNKYITPVMVPILGQKNLIHAHPLQP